VSKASRRAVDPSLALQLLRDALVRVRFPLRTVGAEAAEDVRDAVPVEATFRPDPATRERYDRLYAEFPRLYKAQRRMFARLNA